MALTKDTLRLNNSDYYKIPKIREQPINHTLTFEDVADPGKVALNYGFSHEMWKVLLRFNSIVDPIDELIPGLILSIPNAEDLKRLKQI